MEITTTQYAYAERMRDLISQMYNLKVIADAEAIGLNYDAVYEITDEKTWHGIGDFLSPKTVVGRYFNEPGLNFLEYKAKREDDFKGELKIRIYSTQSETMRFGVGLNLNDHYIFEQTSISESARLESIFDTFSQRIEKLKNISEKIIEDCINQ